MDLVNRTVGSLTAPCRPAGPGSGAQTQGEGGTSSPHSPLLGFFGLATLLVGILLLIGDLMLSTRPEQGLAEFLSGSAAAEAIRASWEQRGLLAWAKGLLLLDSLWVLLYAPFLALLITRLAAEIRADFRTEGRLWPLCSLYILGLVTVLALVVADLIENWTAIGLLDNGSRGIAPAPDSLTAQSSVAKVWLARASVALAAALLLTWFFNLFNVEARRRLITDPRAGQRVLLRLGVADILWRSRYVLFTLVFFAAIVLAMDQGRDVLAGMAEGIDEPGRWPWVAGGVVISVVGVWVFAYACWLWSRVMARMLRPDDDVLGLSRGEAAHRSPDGRDAFAKWWARLLGMTPFLMLALLCGLASRDAMRAGIQSTAVLLFWFGVAAVLLATFVLGARVSDKGRIRHSGPESVRLSGDKRKGRYFDVVGDGEAPCELSGPRYRFLWALPDAPLLLPILSLVLFQLVRGIDLAMDGWIPLTLAVIALGLSLWTSVLGLIAQAALRQSVPWVLFLFLAIGVLGGLGWTDNHRVWTTASGAAGPGTLWLMWGFQALLGLVVLGALAWVYFRVASSSDAAGKECRYKFEWPRSGHGGRLATGSALVLATALVLLGSDRLIFPSDSAGAGPSQQKRLNSRNALDDAIAEWVIGLKTDWDAASARGQAPAEVPIYFVSAEGGGIRSAYWTALVLDQLSKSDPDFAGRTFSISGVSGGSVGAAVWHGCQADPDKRSPEHPDRCIAGLGSANLLTPLVSSWLFEDILARVIPTSWCRLPGCGILSRGNWFERSLELDVAQLAEPMVGPSPTEAGLPYLFLNSTWVENGERAIASSVRIDPASFPAAGDQLAQIGRDLLLSTAAHNSARFTYVNAIGSVVGTPKNADGGKPVEGSHQGNGGEGPDRDDRLVDGGHLADGGYFDNSGGHTTDDILRAFRRCLFEPSDPCGMDERDADLREWALTFLIPQAIQIRNGIGAPTAQEQSARTAECPADFHKPVEGLSWYSDLIGPVLTAFNAVGTGANGRVSEANICTSVMAWRLLSGATHRDLPPLRRIDLTRREVLFPLGWYLSPTARGGMERASAGIGPPARPHSGTALESETGATVHEEGRDWRSAPL